MSKAEHQQIDLRNEFKFPVTLQKKNNRLTFVQVLWNVSTATMQWWLPSFRPQIKLLTTTIYLYLQPAVWGKEFNFIRSLKQNASAGVTFESAEKLKCINICLECCGWLKIKSKATWKLEVTNKIYKKRVMPYWSDVTLVYWRKK